MTDTGTLPDEKETSLKQVFGGLFVLGYALFILVFSVWLLVSGGFNEPVMRLLLFFSETNIEPQSWSWSAITGFALLKLCLAIGLMFLLHVVLRKKPEMFLEKWSKLLDANSLTLSYKVLGDVSAEEIIFRWLPLAVLYPIWGTNFALWTIVILSSVAFAVLHVSNQEPGNRNPIFTLPQFISGLIFSYLFLATALL